MEQRIIKLSELHFNEGQIEGLPSNPRNITEANFEKLKKSLTDNPEMLKLREVIAYDNGGELVVIMGNMRLKAMRDLGFTSVPVKILSKDTPTERLKAYTILDNAPFGKWDWDMLANEWEAQQLTDWGVDLPIMESEINPDEFFDDVENAKEKEDEAKITVHIPDDLKEQKAEIKQAVEDALQGYSGVKVK